MVKTKEGGSTWSPRWRSSESSRVADTGSTVVVSTVAQSDIHNEDAQ